MAARNSIDCLTVEFLRYGGEPGILALRNRYIRTAGYDETAAEVETELDQKQFVIHFNRLRYRRGDPPGRADEARAFLGGHASKFLPPSLPIAESGLTQLDVVTHAAELWAFPFEACYALQQAWLESAERGLVLTRRIRGMFSETVPPWPEIPSVLFVHAPVTRDLERDLVDGHVNALRRALAPWAGGGDPIKKKLLSVCEATSANQIGAARAKLDVPPSFVHVLAHGALVPDPDLPGQSLWGLRLDYEGAPGVHPAEVADALQPANGLPVVVTLAACDSGNQNDPAMGNHSVVQELHRRGVPVAIGSQLPLTKVGSVDFTREFYDALLRGRDVRTALHAGRVALRGNAEAGHDWLSLVGYVRLPPEGYAEHLLEFGLRAELGMLRALQSEADELTINGGSEERFGELKRLLEVRIGSLESRQQELRRDDPKLQQECSGLLASAHKRFAELLYTRANLHAATGEQDREESRQALERSRETYRAAFRGHPQSHWLGMQQLSLEAVLTGRLSRPRELDLVQSVAELALDNDPDDLWSYGTLVEVLLLAPIAGQPRNLAAIRDTIGILRARAQPKRDLFVIESTRRQLNRYATWWTTGNGFFPGGADLSGDARQLIDLLQCSRR